MNILERYLLPLSHTKVTTWRGAVCSRQYRKAAATRVPDDDPAEPAVPLEEELVAATAVYKDCLCIARSVAA